MHIKVIFTKKNNLDTDELDALYCQLSWKIEKYLKKHKLADKDKAYFLAIVHTNMKETHDQYDQIALKVEYRPYFESGKNIFIVLHGWKKIKVIHNTV